MMSGNQGQKEKLKIINWPTRKELAISSLFAMMA